MMRICAVTFEIKVAERGHMEVQHFSKLQPDRIIIGDTSFQQVARQNAPIPAITKQFPEKSQCAVGDNYHKLQN